jgi:hypothetical protein
VVAAVFLLCNQNQNHWLCIAKMAALSEHIECRRRQIMKISFYRCDDTSNVYALDGLGHSGIFMKRSTELDDGEWRFIAPYSASWDFQHQKIFRQHRASEFEPLAQDFSLPDLPEFPDPPPEGWKEYFREKAHARVSTYPQLFSSLSNNTQRRVTVNVLLYEDRYESMFGDGKFHDFAGAFIDREAFLDRKEERETQAGESNTYHARDFTLEWDDDFCFSNNFEVKTFDHFKR